MVLCWKRMLVNSSIYRKFSRRLSVFCPIATIVLFQVNIQFTPAKQALNFGIRSLHEPRVGWRVRSVFRAVMRVCKNSDASQEKEREMSIAAF